MEENKPKYIEDDEITLKELILKVQEFYTEIIRNWTWILFITIPLIVFMLYRSSSTPTKYLASLTFMLNEEENSAMGALGGLAASFLGGSSGGEFNLDKMLALAKSRNIIQRALFEKIELNGETDFYGNHLITMYGFHEKWEEHESLKKFKFTHDSLAVFNRTENSALKRLHSLVIGSAKNPGLLSNVKDDTGIINMNLSSNNEDLSINLVKTIYTKLSNFYIDKAIEQQKQTYLLVKAKTDSLRKELNNTQYQLLKFKDSQRNLSLRQYGAQELRLQRNTQILSLAYGEALKNLEMADFSLKSKTPFIQSIDIPIAPIAPIKESKIKSIILGGVLGLFISIILIIGRKIIRDAIT